MLSVWCWSDWVKKNSTDSTWSVFACCNSNISFFSPWCGPWVSDNEIVLASFSTITYSSDCMVKVGSASWWVKNTTCVVLEISICFNWNACWLLVNSGLQLSYTLWLNWCIWKYFYFFFCCNSMACSIKSFVWIVFFEFKWILFGVIKGPFFKTTIASWWLRIAVNELLFC